MWPVHLICFLLVLDRYAVCVQVSVSWRTSTVVAKYLPCPCARICTLHVQACPLDPVWRLSALLTASPPAPPAYILTTPGQKIVIIKYLAHLYLQLQIGHWVCSIYSWTEMNVVVQNFSFKRKSFSAYMASKEFITIRHFPNETPPPLQIKKGHLDVKVSNKDKVRSY